MNPTWMMLARQWQARSTRRRLLSVAAALVSVALLSGVVALVPGVASARICDDCGPGDGDGDDDGGGGGGYDPPPTPVAYVSGRTVHSITIGWFAALDVPNMVDVYTGSNWSRVATIQPGGAPVFEHGPLASDSRHCYRVTAGGLTSDSVCAYTMDGIAGLRTVWRVQVQLTTGDIAGAGTDDRVRIGLGGPIGGETGSSTWLDHDRDDFEPSDVRNYDLVDLQGVSDLGDIEHLVISKQGSDDWCLKSVRLIVNESQVFEKNFFPPCRWVTGWPDGTVQIGHQELHAGPAWRSYRSPVLAGFNLLMVVIPHDQITGQIETRVGNTLRNLNEDWDEDGEGAQLTQVSSQRAHVHFDVGGSGGAEMDVDFDLVVGTHRDGGRWFVDVTTENANANVRPGWMWPFVIMSGWNEVRGPEKQAEVAIEQMALQSGISSFNFWDVAARFDALGNLIITVTVGCPPTSNCMPDPVGGLSARDVTYGLAEPSATWWPSTGATRYRVYAAGSNMFVSDTSASWAAPNAVGTFTVQVTPLYDFPNGTVVEGQPASATYRVKFNEKDCLPGRPAGCIPH